MVTIGSDICSMASPKRSNVVDLTISVAQGPNGSSAKHAYSRYQDRSYSTRHHFWPSLNGDRTLKTSGETKRDSIGIRTSSSTTY